MSKLDKRVLLYRTVTSGNTPSADNIDYGELSLNYNSNTPFVAFKDDKNNIQKLGALSSTTGDSEYHTMSQKSITDAISNIKHTLSDTYESVVYPTDTDGVVFTPASANMSLDEAVKQVDTNVATLVDEVLKNELVTAAAITKHNESAGFNQNGEYVVDTASTYINDARNLSDADILLDSAIKSEAATAREAETALRSDIDVISGNTYTKAEIDGKFSSSNEVYIGSSKPSIESVELFIDESIDPISVEVYSKQEIDTKIITLNDIDKDIQSQLGSKITYGINTSSSTKTDLYVDISEDKTIEVYTKAQVDSIIAQLKADNNLK